MPTKLGNLLRAAASRITGKYALEAAVVWPRLELVIPAQPCQVLNATQEQFREASVLRPGALFCRSESLRALFGAPQASAFRCCSVCFQPVCAYAQRRISVACSVSNSLARPWNRSSISFVPPLPLAAIPVAAYTRRRIHQWSHLNRLSVALLALPISSFHRGGNSRTSRRTFYRGYANSFLQPPRTANRTLIRGRKARGTQT